MALQFHLISMELYVSTCCWEHPISAHSNPVFSGSKIMVLGKKILRRLTRVINNWQLGIKIRKETIPEAHAIKIIIGKASVLSHQSSSLASALGGCYGPAPTCEGMACFSVPTWPTFRQSNLETECFRPLHWCAACRHACSVSPVMGCLTQCNIKCQPLIGIHSHCLVRFPYTVTYCNCPSFLFFWYFLISFCSAIPHVYLLNFYFLHIHGLYPSLSSSFVGEIPLLVLVC